MRCQTARQLKPMELKFLLANFGDIRDAVSILMGHFSTRDYMDFDRDSIELVCSEILNNIVEHGGPSAHSSYTLVRWHCDKTLDFEIHDRGRAYPNLQCPVSDMPDPNTLPEGGFGWGLIDMICSNLRYDRVGSENRLRFTFTKS